MKKTLFSISLAAMLTFGACSTKTTENADDSAVMADSTETVSELPDGNASAASITDALKGDGCTINDAGDIVDKDGTVVMTFNEAKEKYGEAYESVMESYGKSFKEALKAAGENIKDAAGDAVETAKEKAKETYDEAKEKASAAAENAYNSAKEKGQEKIDEAKDKAKEKLNDALNKLK